MGLSLLCDVMLLRNSNLAIFSSRFSQANCVLIRSLTITIEAERPERNSAGQYIESEEPMKRNGSAESKVLWGRLQDLAAMISNMTNLSILSFVVPSNVRFPGFWIPRSIIASMMENLSKSCVNLEIDTRGHDFDEADSVHLCDKIRVVLPRLRHFRVRLGVSCPAMFRAGVNAVEIIEDHSTAPHLEIVVVNSVQRSPGFPCSARLCGSPWEHPWYQSFGNDPELRVSLATTLRDLVVHGNYPKIERLWLIDMQYHDNDDPTVYGAHNRRDIVLNKTWAIPLRNITGTHWDSVLMRTPEMQEFFSFQWAIDELVEAQTWKETLNGCRMPAATIATDYFQREDCWEKPLPIESVEALKFRIPTLSCRLWWNERKTGLRILHAFERQGLVDTSPVREITPSGWRSDYEDLVPET